MKITDLQVHDGYIVARLQGIPAFTIKLDGWARSRPATEFSFFPESGWIVLGSTEKPLREGERTLTATDALDSHTMPFYMGTPPEAEPEIEWTLVRRIDKRADWNTILTPASGSSVTDTAEGMRFRQPNNGERCEGQIHRPEDGAPREGELWAMEWEFRIDSALSTADPRGYNLISQLHADNAGGFTGGVVVTPAGPAYARVKGGEEYDLKGSHAYEYEDALELGLWQPPGWHRVRIETDWSSWYQARMNDRPWSRVENKPIWPKGNADGDPSDVIMVRLGWYPHQGRVPEGGLDMTTRRACIYKAAR